VDGDSGPSSTSLKLKEAFEFLVEESSRLWVGSVMTIFLSEVGDVSALLGDIEAVQFGIAKGERGSRRPPMKTKALLMDEKSEMKYTERSVGNLFLLSTITRTRWVSSLVKYTCCTAPEGTSLAYR
jgi:hypothetical protein